MPALAALSAMVSKIFRVDLVSRIDPLDPGVENFQRRHHEVGRVEHVEHGAAGPGQPLLHDEGKLGLDPRADEAVGWHEPAIGKEHVVEQHAGIRLVDIERALHRLRGQADLVALDDAAFGDLDLDPRLLDRIGILDGDVGIIPARAAGSACASSPPDGAARRRARISSLERAMLGGRSGEKGGCGNMINMLNGSHKPNWRLLQCKLWRRDRMTGGSMARKKSAEETRVPRRNRQPAGRRVPMREFSRSLPMSLLRAREAVMRQFRPSLRQSRPDRAAMAYPARARRDRRHRGHRAGAGGVSAWGRACREFCAISKRVI